MKTTDNIILDITLQQAMADLDEGNYVAAFRGFESITDESLEAKYQMAMMMYNGYVEGYDASDAIQLYNECAESGLNKAFGGIACCYFYGHGVEKNDIKGRTSFDADSDFGIQKEAWKAILILRWLTTSFCTTTKNGTVPVILPA